MNLRDASIEELEKEIKCRKDEEKKIHDAKEADALSKQILEDLRSLFGVGEIYFSHNKKWVLGFDVNSRGTYQQHQHARGINPMRIYVNDSKIVLQFDECREFTIEAAERGGITIDLHDPKYAVAVAEAVRDAISWGYNRAVESLHDYINEIAANREEDNKWCEDIIERAEWRYLENSAKRAEHNKRFKQNKPIDRIIFK